MRNHKTEDEDELKETGDTNWTIWMLIYQNRAEMKTAFGVFVIATEEAWRRDDGVVFRLTTFCPPQQTVIGAVMSDDVNYVSKYFYTEKHGQIGSGRGSGRRTVCSECSVHRRTSQGVITRGWEMIAVEIASVINQAVVDMSHSGGGSLDASAAFGGCA